MTTHQIRTLVTVDDEVEGGIVERVLADEALLVQGIGNPATGWPAQDSADALLVICREGSAEGLELVRRGRAAFPDRPVVVACAGHPNGYLREAFLAGAEDVVEIPLDGGVATDASLALAKAVARRGTETPVRTSAGRIVTVLGSKGGTGKTLVATNLAVGLALEGQDAVLVDLDLQFGDVGLTMGLRPEKTIYDLALGTGALDATKVEGHLVRHESGARALLAPLRPDQAAVVTPELVSETLGVLQTVSPFVVVDTPPMFLPEVIAALDASTDVCVVAMLDALSLKNTKIALETLKLMSVEADIRLVLNRSDTNVGISHTDVVAVLGRAPDVLVPSSRNVVRAVNAGEPIVMSAKRNESAKALRALATLHIDADR